MRNRYARYGGKQKILLEKKLDSTKPIYNETDQSKRQRIDRNRIINLARNIINNNEQAILIYNAYVPTSPTHNLVQNHEGIYIRKENTDINSLAINDYYFLDEPLFTLLNLINNINRRFFFNFTTTITNTTNRITVVVDNHPTISRYIIDCNKNTIMFINNNNYELCRMHVYGHIQHKSLNVDITQIYHNCFQKSQEKSITYFTPIIDGYSIVDRESFSPCARGLIDTQPDGYCFYRACAVLDNQSSHQMPIYYRLLEDEDQEWGSPYSYFDMHNNLDKYILSDSTRQLPYIYDYQSHDIRSKYNGLIQLQDHIIAYKAKTEELVILKERANILNRKYPNKSKVIITAYTTSCVQRDVAALNSLIGKTQHKCVDACNKEITPTTEYFDEIRKVLHSVETRKNVTNTRNNSKYHNHDENKIKKAIISTMPTNFKPENTENSQDELIIKETSSISSINTSNAINDTSSKTSQEQINTDSPSNTSELNSDPINSRDDLLVDVSSKLAETLQTLNKKEKKTALSNMDKVTKYISQIKHNLQKRVIEEYAGPNIELVPIKKEIANIPTHTVLSRDKSLIKKHIKMPPNAYDIHNSPASFHYTKLTQQSVDHSLNASASTSTILSVQPLDEQPQEEKQTQRIGMRQTINKITTMIKEGAIAIINKAMDKIQPKINPSLYQYEKKSHENTISLAKTANKIIDYDDKSGKYLYDNARNQDEKVRKEIQTHHDTKIIDRRLDINTHQMISNYEKKQAYIKTEPENNREPSNMPTTLIFQDMIYYEDVSLAIINDVTHNHNINSFYITVQKFPDNVGTYIFPNEHTKIEPENQVHIYDEDGNKQIIMIPNGNTPYQHPFPKLFGKKLVKGRVYSHEERVDKDTVISISELSQYSVDADATEIAIIRGIVVRNGQYSTPNVRLHNTRDIIYQGTNFHPTQFLIDYSFYQQAPNFVNRLKKKLNLFDLIEQPEADMHIKAIGKYTMLSPTNTGNPHSTLAQIRKYMRQVVSVLTEYEYRVYISGHNEVDGNPRYYHVQSPIVSNEDHGRSYNSQLKNTRRNVGLLAATCRHITHTTTICDCLRQAGYNTPRFSIQRVKYWFLYFYRRIFSYRLNARFEKLLMKTTLPIKALMISDIFTFKTCDAYIEHMQQVLPIRRNSNGLATTEILLDNTETLRYIYYYTQYMYEYRKIEETQTSFLTSLGDIIAFIFLDIRYYKHIKVINPTSYKAILSTPFLYFIIVHLLRNYNFIAIILHYPVTIAEYWLAGDIGFTMFSNVVLVIFMFNDIIQLYNYLENKNYIDFSRLIFNFIATYYVNDNHLFVLIMAIYMIVAPRRMVRQIILITIINFIPGTIQHQTNTILKPELINIRGITYILKHCISKSALQQIRDFIIPRHVGMTYHSYQDGKKVPHFQTIKCDNKKNNHIGAAYIIPKPILPYEESEKYLPSVYHSCALTALHPILTRQLKSDLQQPIDSSIYYIIYHYATNYFGKIKKSIGGAFSYSYSQYYNHLNTKQKKEMDDVRALIDKEGIFRKTGLVIYNIFRKLGEKLVNRPEKFSKVRNISGSPSLLKYIIGPFIYGIQKLIYKLDYAHDQPGSDMQLSRQLNRDINNLESGAKMAIEIDGSSFDSTQWKVILFFLDYTLYSLFLSIIVTTVHVSLPILKVALGQIDIVGYSFIIGYIVNGTVASGKSNTTLGNTQRSAFYVRYIAINAKLREGKHFCFKATGDDILIIILKKYVEAFTKNLQYTYSTKAFCMGQVAKDIKICEIEHASYLSMRILKTRLGYYYIKDPTRALSNLFLTTKIAPNSKANVANNIRYCIKQVASLSLGFIPFFNNIINTIETGDIKSEYFNNWLDKRTRNDNDYRHIKNIIHGDDSLHKFIRENNLYNDVYSWLYSYYNITMSDIRNNRHQTIVDKIYHNTPICTIVQPNTEAPVLTLPEILRNMDEYFATMQFKSDYIDIKHDHQTNHLCSVEFKKGMVPIYIEQEGSTLNQTALNVFYKKNITSVTKIIKKSNVNLLGYVARTTPIHHYPYL